jgi:hypothetical protein
MTAVGSTALPAPSFRSASRTAIALSAVAVRTNEEQRLASLAATNSRPEHRFSMNRHPPAEAVFDISNGSCERRASFDGGLLMKVATPEPRWFEQRGSLPPQKPQYNLPLKCFEVDDRTEDRACGADDVVGAVYAGQGLRKLRFPMTDNTVLCLRVVPL